ncbi:MAG: hypothetical protein IJL25_11335 [Clostridia bacterium]|nr:hypothetical protein [Clostridia bacterium]
MKKEKQSRKQNQKKSGFRPANVIYPFLCLFAGAVWLAPFQYSWDYAWPLIGFIASLFLIDLIRQPVIAFLLAAAASAGLCFLNVLYTVCFAPFVLVYFLIRYVYGEKKVKPVKSDGFFLVARLVSVAFAVAGFAAAYNHFQKQPDIPLQFHREFVFLLIIIALFLFSAFYKRRAAGKGENGELSGKIRHACFIGIVCVPAVALFISSTDPYVKLSSLPAFLVSSSLLCSLADPPPEKRGSGKKGD